MSAKKITKAKLGDHLYDLTLLRVDKRDELGRPLQVTLVYEDTAQSMYSRESFIPAYVREDLLKPRTRGDA